MIGSGEFDKYDRQYDRRNKIIIIIIYLSISYLRSVIQIEQKFRCFASSIVLVRAWESFSRVDLDEWEVSASENSLRDNS